MNRVTAMFLMTLLAPSPSAVGQGEQKQLFTYAFPQLVSDRAADQACRRAVAAYPAYTVNFSGRASARSPIENAVVQVMLNRRIGQDGMTERNRSFDATFTLFLGRTGGFYASVKTHVFCLFSKTSTQK